MTKQSASRVLLVEDDAKLAVLVRTFLESHGYDVSIEANGAVAESRIREEAPDLVVLDIMLPGKDGLSICRDVRPYYKNPILILTARGEESDEVSGLDLGADDYMAKPVKPRLLLARVEALLRRQKREESLSQSKVTIGALVVDATRRSVKVDQKPIELTSGEFDLLWLLACNAGEVIDRDRICRELRGMEYDGLDRSVDLRVTRLRKKLGDDGKRPRMIKSIRSVGYLLVADL